MTLMFYIVVLKFILVTLTIEIVAVPLVILLVYFANCMFYFKIVLKCISQTKCNITSEGANGLNGVHCKVFTVSHAINFDYF